MLCVSRSGIRPMMRAHPLPRFEEALRLPLRKRPARQSLVCRQWRDRKHPGRDLTLPGVSIASANSKLLWLSLQTLAEVAHDDD